MNSALSAARAAGRAAAAAVPAGLGPSDIRAAYNLASASSSGRTVAIVDAYHDPTAAADLATYRQQYGLPGCGTGCFTQLNQNGVAGPYPSEDAGWAEEISLDLDMVSATCPDCKILLVEANSSSLTDLGAAVNTAAKQPGVVAISNSYGGSDLPDSTYGAPYYNHPGIAVTASSGDSGYGASFPADSSYVTAVGGTTLRAATNTRGWTESAWSGAGSGCSRYNQRFQPSTVYTGCSQRAEADVSAVADPATGVAVYDTTVPSGTAPGWLVFGGTSASSPIIASVYALAGHAGNSSYSATQLNTLPYAQAASLHDVTSGSNGHCRTKVLCTAGTGWDGPTGLGTPNGTGAF